MIRIHVCSDILTFGAAGTVELLLSGTSSGLIWSLTMFLGAVAELSLWFQLLALRALSNFHSAQEQIEIKSRLPVGVNSPIVVELEVDKLEM